MEPRLKRSPAITTQEVASEAKWREIETRRENEREQRESSNLSDERYAHNLTHYILLYSLTCPKTSWPSG